MIKIKDLTVKNFMSVGNQTQAVDFDHEQLTLVLGENLDQGGDDSGSRNGTGKTTIINALSYALYGKALTNIRANNLINKTNSKGMIVTLQFEKDGNSYRLERGRGPNFFKFYINNQESLVDESQGDSRQTQDDVNTLLGMSHDMFKHIVALNTYTEPFLSMRVNDQRQIIEQLLGITILSEKADLLKEQTRQSKDAITEETLKINAIQTANEKIEVSIEQLAGRQRAWVSKHKQDQEKLANAIDQLEHLDIETELALHEKLSNWTEHNNKITSLRKELSTLEPALQRADKSVAKLDKDITELEDATCYTCGQELHADKKAEIAERKDKELIDAKAYQIEVSGKLSHVITDLEAIGEINGKPTTFYDSAKEAYEHRSNVDNLKQTLDTKIAEEDPYTAQITDLNETAIQKIDWGIVNELTSFKEHQEFLLKLLTNKDSFIRKKIIDQNLAYLNNRLTYLNVEITQLGQDLDFDNLSRGERNRLILGLSFAFRDVWESLYQNINLLFIDELIDSGMDTAGVENSLSVLKKMAREREKNIYLISHKDELIGRVNHVLRVVKENGFTSYANDLEVVE
jgi:DNA repair exonuclease SbcCD ATPase subunit